MVEAPSNADISQGVPSMATRAGLVSVIIPNYDGAHFLGPCLRSLFAQELAEAELEVLVIDNGSRDGSVELVQREFPCVHVVANITNAGFTRAINQGLELARGEWILLLNNDTVLDPGALRILLDQLRQSEKDVAGVQPLLLWAEDRRIVDSAGIVLGKRFAAHDHLHGKPFALAPATVTETWGVCFACALIRRAVFECAGNLDPDFFAEWDDVDLATRARWLGYKFLIVPDARVLHYRSPTSQRDSVAKFTRLRRNRLLTYLKCLPCGMAAGLILYRMQHDFGMLIHFARERQLGAVWRSWLDVFKLAPRMLRRRADWRRQAHLSSRQMLTAIKKAMRDG